MDMNTINVPITTVFERNSMLTFLDQFDQIIFNAQIDVKSWVNENAPAGIKVVILNYFTDEILASSPEELFGKSKELRAHINGLDTIGISVPREIDKEFSEKLVALVKNTTQRSMLLDIKIDKALIAGAIIESNGFVMENSIRSFFDKRLLGRRDHGF
jgi:F0F1-type ATP synthase delta subunit